MKCHDALQKLNRYVDGELDAATRRPLDEHLANCASCHEALMEHRRLAGSLHQALAPTPAPAGFDEAVMHAIEAQTPTPRRDSKPVMVRRPFSITGFFEDVARAFGVVGEWFRDFRNWRM